MLTLFVVFLAVHGLIHLLGFAKAFRVAELPQLTQPISPAMGVLWLAAGLLFMSTALFLVVWPRWWLIAGASAVAISTIAIVPSWTDARVGAYANVVVLIGLVAGFLVQGPFSLRAVYETEVDRCHARQPAASVLDEADLAHLPPPVQRYLRASRVVGQPRVHNVRAHMHGRIRSGPGARWMPFRAEQYNVFAGDRARLFYMSGTMSGLPFHGLHRYVGPSASMLVKVAGAVTVADSSGTDMTRAETVTLFNDMCVMAPATLIDRSIVWEAIDDHVVRATFTNAGHSVRAELQFNPAGELMDFWSDDRMASVDGKTMTAMRWSTPLTAYRPFGAVRLASRGEGRWHAADGEFAYVELEIDQVDYNVSRRDR